MSAPEPFRTVRDAALSILNDPECRLSWVTAGFLGSITAATRPLSQKQRDWLSKELEKASKPSLAGEAQ